MLLNKKPTVLIISSWYPSPEDVTNGSFVHEQVKMLKKRGHEVVVVKPNLNGSFSDTIKGKKIKSKVYSFEGVGVYEVGVNVYFPKLKSVYYNILRKKVEKTIVEQQLNFDIIHSHSLLSAGVIAANISTIFSKPLIHTEHTSALVFSPNEFDAIDRQAIHRLINIAKNIFFVSSFSLEKSLIFKDAISTKISVLHNVVDDSFFELQTSEKNNSIVVIGDFGERKNQLFLLDVWKELQKKNIVAGIKLLFIGNGFESTEFIEKSEGIKNIEVKNRLNRDEILTEISTSQLLLSSSLIETFGLTIAEALALGVPVVVTNSGGPKDIVEEGDGFIVDFDKMSFLEKVEEVLKGNHDEATIIRERCKSKFSENVIYLKLVEAYKNSVSQ